LDPRGRRESRANLGTKCVCSVDADVLAENTYFARRQ
jgi:hypothetical protein